MNTRLLDEIEAESGRLEKEKLIGKMDERTRKFVRMALDPAVTFGVTVDEDEHLKIWREFTPEFMATLHPDDRFEDTSRYSPQAYWEELGKLSNFLSSRFITGDCARANVTALVRRAPSERDAKWTCRLFNRNLRAGFDITLFNAVWPSGEDRVQKFEVQLAETWEGQDLEGNWLFQPKLDGNRVTVVDGRAMSRGGKEYKACKHVLDELQSALGPDFLNSYVLDGEMMGNLGFDKSSGALRRLDSAGNEAQFTYWVFDLVERGEWRKQRTRPLSQRIMELERLVGGAGLQHTRLVESTRRANPTSGDVMAICREYLSRGFEGAMAKDLDAPYKFKRGDNLLKVKMFSEADLEVYDLYEGRGKHKGRLGGIYVRGKIKWGPPGQPQREYDIDCKCGSGFDDALREQVWADRAGWTGAVVTVQFQDATEDGSLRFPVFVMRRDDKGRRDLFGEIKEGLSALESTRLTEQVMREVVKDAEPTGAERYIEERRQDPEFREQMDRETAELAGGGAPQPAPAEPAAAPAAIQKVSARLSSIASGEPLPDELPAEWLAEITGTKKG